MSTIEPAPRDHTAAADDGARHDGAVDLPVGLVQPDARSCGAASLVAARMTLDPAYATRIVDGDRFAAETLAMHRRVTGPATLDGRAQLPWPRMIGTPPWAVAHQLSATGGPTAAPTPYAVRLVRHTPHRAVDLLRGAPADRPVALYVGDRWLPRHVVLVVGESGSGLSCYDPARGRIVSVEDRAFAETRLPFGRWTHAWFVVAPRISRARRTPA